MDRETVIRRLKDHEGELRAMGVTRLALFGSMARGDAGPDSDVDILVDLDPAKRISLIGYCGIRLFLCDLLETEVDMVERAALRPRLRDTVLGDARDVL